MCLKPQPLPPLPESTRQAAAPLFEAQHVLRLIGDSYADLLRDEDFGDLYSHTGQPALSPARLALITVLQAREHCSDRVALEMVRWRIDWKYALHLPLDDAGFDPSVLCEFRQRLVTHQATRRVFDAFLERLRAQGWLSGHHLQRTDSIAVVGAIRELNRLELVMETLRLALEAIATQDATWCVQHTPAAWRDPYGQWTQAERVVKDSGARGQVQTQTLLLQTGRDGFLLVEALEHAAAPPRLGQLAAVDLLRQVWTQQYQRVAASQGPGVLLEGPVEGPAPAPLSAPLPAAQGAAIQNMDTTPPPNPPVPEAPHPPVPDAPTRAVTTPPLTAASSESGRSESGRSESGREATRKEIALCLRAHYSVEERRALIESPHDPEARFAIKRGQPWTGYKLHLTETASEAAPTLITDVAVAPACSYDAQALAAIQERLASQGQPGFIAADPLGGYQLCRWRDFSGQCCPSARRSPAGTGGVGS